MYLLLLLFILLILLAILVGIYSTKLSLNNIYGGVIEKIDGSPTTERNGYLESKIYDQDTIYFGLEKLTNENIGFWFKHANKNIRTISELERTPFYDSENQVIQINSKIESFKESLALFGQMNNKWLPRDPAICYDIWIAYAANKNPKGNPLLFLDSIEICVSVMCKENCPIVSQAGCFQSTEFYTNKQLRSHSLFIALMNFASTAIQFECPIAKYLVIRPNTKAEQKAITDSTKDSTKDSISKCNLWIGSQYDIDHHLLTQSTSPINDLEINWRVIIEDNEFDIEIPLTIECPRWILSKSDLDPSDDLSHSYLKLKYGIDNKIEIDEYFNPWYPFFIININTKSKIHRLAHPKEGCYQKLTLPLQTKDGCSTVYFALEKLTKENKKFWSSYSNRGDGTNSNQRNIISKPSDENGIRRYYDAKAILENTFKTNLTLFDQASGQYDVWVAYAAEKDPNIIRTDMQKIDDIDSIEMTFGVFAKDGIPITSHMGISKSMAYSTIKFNNSHKSLSVPLHIFAMKSCKLIYPIVEYMVTNPSGTMLSILLAKVQTGCV